MLNYRRHIAFTSRVHSYITLLYVVVFFLFLLSMQLESNEGLFNILFMLSKVIGWSIILLGLYILIASISITFSSKVLTLSPFFLTLVRVGIYIAFALILEFVATLTESGLSIGVKI